MRMRALPIILCVIVGLFHHIFIMMRPRSMTLNHQYRLIGSLASATAFGAQSIHDHLSDYFSGCHLPAWFSFFDNICRSDHDSCLIDGLPLELLRC